MAKYNAAKIEECEAWVAAHGLIDYGGAKLKEFVREMGIDEKTYRLWMKGKTAVQRGHRAGKGGFQTEPHPRSRHLAIQSRQRV